jgi:hypothetical protein
LHTPATPILPPFSLRTCLRSNMGHLVCLHQQLLETGITHGMSYNGDNWQILKCVKENRNNKRKTWLLGLFIYINSYDKRWQLTNSEDLSEGKRRQERDGKQNDNNITSQYLMTRVSIWWLIFWYELQI